MRDYIFLPLARAWQEGAFEGGREVTHHVPNKWGATLLDDTNVGSFVPS